MLRLPLRLFWCSTPSIPSPPPLFSRFRFNNPFAIHSFPRAIVGHDPRHHRCPTRTPSIPDFFRRGYRSTAFYYISRDRPYARNKYFSRYIFEPIRSIGGRNKNIVQIVFSLYRPSIYLFVYFLFFLRIFVGRNKTFFFFFGKNIESYIS